MILLLKLLCEAVVKGFSLARSNINKVILQNGRGSAFNKIGMPSAFEKIENLHFKKDLLYNRISIKFFLKAPALVVFSKALVL